MKLAAEPQLFVSDLGASLDFYDRLGFGTVFVHGQPPFYAQVAREAARFNLRQIEGRIFDAGFRARNADALAATITCDDVAALFADYVASDATFHQPLRREPWGARTFILADPDGNLILFAG